AKPATGQLGDAVQVLDNPQGAAYTAVIPAGKFGTMRGTVTAVATQGNGTQFNINFSGLPSTGGPFLYHIHVNPIPSNGSCASTLAHLDPYIRGEATPCVPEFPETCQVGDLSGKHGKPNATTFNATYIDPYVSLIDGQGAFFGNRSFVIHLADKTRIACANFFPIDNLPSEPSASGFPYGPSNSSSTTAPTFSVPVPP
ncbi:Cu,Zn superoxide dismutase-like protein, partial [Trichodelitschia bisporula]